VTVLAPGGKPLRLPAGELLPPLHDDVAVEGVDLHQERPLACSQAMNVAPDPPKRSRTFSPGRLEYWMARPASSTGFSVRCTILGSGIFLTCHRSVALFGPKK